MNRELAIVVEILCFTDFWVILSCFLYKKEEENKQFRNKIILITFKIYLIEFQIGTAFITYLVRYQQKTYDFFCINFVLYGILSNNNVHYFTIYDYLLCIGQ